MLVTLLPTPGEFFDLGTEQISDYWKVARITGTRRRRVFLARCGSDKRRVIGMKRFLRMGPRRSPR